MFKKLWKSEKGFTLMELIIVIVILGILALIAVPRLLGFTDQAKIANDKEYAAIIARAAELHWAANTPDSTTEVTYDSDTSTANADLSATGVALFEAPGTALQYLEGGSYVCVVSTSGVARVTLFEANGGLGRVVFNPANDPEYSVTPKGTP